ncbi:MAG: hypothetical protein WCQ99_14480 [Pseudomonadota bacterium]
MLQSTESKKKSDLHKKAGDLFFAHTIKRQIHSELCSMGGLLNLGITDEPLHTIYRTAALQLLEIEKLFSERAIDPFVEIRTSCDDSILPELKKTVRIGVYPLAANPFHWGHLLIGLSAIARLKLDKVVYVIAGHDVRKPDLAPAEIRHPMAQDVLKMFEPLFCYSSVALDTDYDGETNLLRILSLNPLQKIEAFYLAGADHYRRCYPGTQYPDTIQKLEDNMFGAAQGFNENIHSISAAFIERGTHEGIFDTFLNVQFLPAMPFKASSTMIREAFEGKRDGKALAILPYTAYVDIRAFNLYSPFTKPEDVFMTSPVVPEPAYTHKLEPAAL